MVTQVYCGQCGCRTALIETRRNTRAEARKRWRCTNEECATTFITYEKETTA